MTATRPPISHVPSPPMALSDYAALRDFVDRAAHGEIDLQRPGSQAETELPLPSGWYATAPPPSAPPRLRPETRAAVFGLGAGLLMLVPAALWSQMSQPTVRADSAAMLASFAPGNAEPASDTPTTTPVDVVSVRTISTPEQPAGPTIDPTVEAARLLIRSGDVIGARTTLSTAAAARNPAALFVMAETYDPNMLAAWGARGVGADAERARALYSAALALGHERAAGRIQSLR